MSPGHFAPGGSAHATIPFTNRLKQLSRSSQPGSWTMTAVPDTGPGPSRCPPGSHPRQCPAATQDSSDPGGQCLDQMQQTSAPGRRIFRRPGEDAPLEDGALRVRPQAHHGRRPGLSPQPGCRVPQGVAASGQVAEHLVPACRLFQPQDGIAAGQGIPQVSHPRRRDRQRPAPAAGVGLQAQTSSPSVYAGTPPTLRPKGLRLRISDCGGYGLGWGQAP
jgi:hypothetical protein